MSEVRSARSVPRAAPKPLTAAEVIQAVLADPEYHHVGAHGLEFQAVERLVKQGMEREQAEREVRMLLY